MNSKISLSDNQSFELVLGDFVEIQGWLTRNANVKLELEITGNPVLTRASGADLYLSHLPAKASIIARRAGGGDFPPDHSVIVTVDQKSAGKAITVELPEMRLDGHVESVVGLLIPSEDGSSITVKALGSSVENSLSREAMTTVSALRIASENMALTDSLHVSVEQTASAARAADTDTLKALAEMVKGIKEHYEYELVGDDVDDIENLLRKGAANVGASKLDVEDQTALLIMTDSPRPAMASYDRPTVVVVFGEDAEAKVRLFHEAYGEQTSLEVLAITDKDVQALQEGEHKKFVKSAQVIARGLT